MIWDSEFSVPEALGNGMADLEAVWAVFTTREPGPDDFDRLVAAARHVHELTVLARFEAASALAASPEFSIDNTVDMVLDSNAVDTTENNTPTTTPSPRSLFPLLGLNDRIRYAGALFGGNVEALREACTVLDGLADRQEAHNWLKSRCPVNWEDAQGLPVRFLEWMDRVRT